MPKWTEEEKKYLIENFNSKMTKEIAQFLNKKEKTVATMCRSLGLKKQFRNYATKHSCDKKHPLYQKWLRLKKYKKDKFCKEWYDSYDLFYNWGVQQTDNFNQYIDLIDENGMYEPSNCVFSKVSKLQIARNNNFKKKDIVEDTKQNQSFKNEISLIRNSFIKAKHLLQPYWKSKNEESGIDSTGFCYIASEALFHMIGGLTSGFKPKRFKHDCGYTHWWLYNNITNEILDPTYDQEKAKIDYNLGENASFLTGYVNMSNRTRELLEIIVES